MRDDKRKLLEDLEEGLTPEERIALEREFEHEPASLDEAARGLARVRDLPWLTATPARASGDSARSSSGVSPWWVGLAAALALLASVPTTALVTASLMEGPAGVASSNPTAAPVTRVEATDIYLLLLQGGWADLDQLSEIEIQDRRAEYWGWTQTLSAGGHFIAAGELTGDPGMRVTPVGSGPSRDDPDSDRFMVGLFIVQAGSFEEASRLASASPHLKYGGTVAVRGMSVAAGLRD